MSEKIWEELNTITEALGASPLPPSLSKPTMLTGRDFCILSRCLQDLNKRLRKIEDSLAPFYSPSIPAK